MKIQLSAAALAATSLFVAAVASAHVSANTPVAVANVSQEVTFQIGHGCGIPNVTPETNTDTTSLTVDIPAGVTSVRAVSSTDFPNLSLAKDGAGNVTSITWAKVPGTELAADTNFYKLTLRAKVPNVPFTKIYFKAHQKCKAPGKDAEWIRTATENPDAEDAAVVAVLPPKTPGWNKYTVPVAIADIGAACPAVPNATCGFFKDAQIVWKGSAAYSPNAVIAEQIKGETGVTELKSLAANDEIFVKW